MWITIYLVAVLIFPTWILMIQALVINFIQLTHFLNCSEQNYNKILLSVHWNNFPVTSQILLHAQMRNGNHHHQPDSGWAPESADLSKADMLNRGDNLLKCIWSLCDIVHLRPHPGDGWEQPCTFSSVLSVIHHGFNTQLWFSAFLVWWPGPNF